MADVPRPTGDRPTPSRAASSAPRRRKPLIQAAPPPDKALSTVVKEEVKRDLPGVLISLGVHVAVLMLLAIIPIFLDRPPPVGTIQMEWATAAPRNQKPPEAVKLSQPITLSRSPATAPPPAAATIPAPGTTEPKAVDVQPVIVSGSLSGRARQEGSAARDRDGFSDQARQAIDRALAWLVRQQQSDGRWRLDGPYADGATRTRWSTDVGATALALLAFVGDGNTHLAGAHAEAVSRGVKWLIARQRSSGEIYDGAEEGQEPSIYSHAISTIVLCELIALTGDQQLRSPAEQAVNYLIAAQNPVLGGWRYRPLAESGEGDLSVTGWALMALHTARMAGIEVPSEPYLLASSFLDRCQESPGDAAFYKYTPTYPPDRGQRVSMTSSGLLARQWLGWPRQYTPLLRGSDFLLSDDARPNWDNGHRNVYAWYYQAQVLHNMGGDRWKNWFMAAQDLIVDQQQTSGKESGSWHPTRPPGSVHEWSAVVGRLYVTVMCVLVLETPFRHAPLYGGE